MLNQVEILANNHLNVLNMLYRTKETFLTVIEGQTLINSSIAAEKAALKNIKNIVNIYDCALNEDFSSAFTLMKDLKNNGLDDYSYAQLQDNITNIQSLFGNNIVTASCNNGELDNGSLYVPPSNGSNVRVKKVIPINEDIDLL